MIIFPYILKRLTSTRLVVIIAAIAYLFFSFFLLLNRNFDFSYFITAGDKYLNIFALQDKITYQQNSDGYDGQFYYRLALDPFTSLRNDKGIILDLPSLRQQRIFYPLIVWAFSFGNSAAVPFLMFFVNLIALCVLAYTGAKIAQHYNSNALYGLILPFYPGFLLSLSRDLTEIFCITFISLSLLMFLKKKYLWMALFVVFAVLSRETAIIYLIGLFFYSLIKYFFSRSPKSPQQIIEYRKILSLSSIILCIFFIWQTVLYLNWDKFPMQAGLFFNIDIPFKGLYLNLFNLKSFIYLLEMAYIGFTLFITSYFLRSSKADLPIKISFILYFFLTIFFSKYVWVEDWNFLRTLCELFFFGAIILICSDYKQKFLLLFPTLILWIVLFSDVILNR